MSTSLGGVALGAGTIVAGKYRLIKQLGEGAMGVVWSAVNSATSGEFALKLILRSEPELRQRLIREALACGRIRHRNVVQVLDVGQTTGGDPFLVMELLQGQTLAALLETKRRLPPQEAASIGRDVARALAAAHDSGIVHRDLKPANIFLHNEPGGDAPVVKVLDFGVSKNFLQSDGLRTVAGGAVGSPMYMSPEQARTEREIDGRADVWSLGVVLYEMLTGERPFTGETTEIIARITNGDIPQVSRRIRRIDPDFDEIVAGCLTRDRAVRLGPPMEVARRLEAHAVPEARGPLPSLMEIGPSELAAASGSISGGAPVSPGNQPTSFYPASSPGYSRGSTPGFGPTALMSSDSPGFGPTDLRPSSSDYGATTLGSAEGGDDESTRRMDPSMLAPLGSGTVQVVLPQAGPRASSPGQGPKGTIRMDMGDTEAIRAQVYAQRQAQAQAQATAFSASTEAQAAPLNASRAEHRALPSKKFIAAVIGLSLFLSTITLVVIFGRRKAASPPSSMSSPNATTSAAPLPSASVSSSVPPPPSVSPDPPAPVPTASEAPTAQPVLNHDEAASDPKPQAPSEPTKPAPTATAAPSRPAPTATSRPALRSSGQPQAAPTCKSVFSVNCKRTPSKAFNPKAP